MAGTNSKYKNNNGPTMYVQLLYPDSKAPAKTYETDSGFDAYAHNIKAVYDENNKMYMIDTDGIWNIEIRPHYRVLIGLGIAATVGTGYEIQVRARSGLACKQGLMVANGVGTIDQMYRGEVVAAVINTTNSSISLAKGDKIAQLVPAPVLLPQLVVTTLDDTERGANGFGSTGTK